MLSEADLDGLATVLADCVTGGASVSFMQPFTLARARAFWQDMASDAHAGRRAVLLARDGQGEIVGTVPLVLAQPENQPHRADLAKMLVYRRARRSGLGARLMTAAEALARQHGKTLLVLDTVTGSGAERLYNRLGWLRVGKNRVTRCGRRAACAAPPTSTKPFEALRAAAAALAAELGFGHQARQIEAGVGRLLRRG